MIEKQFDIAAASLETLTTMLASGGSVGWMAWEELDRRYKELVGSNPEAAEFARGLEAIEATYKADDDRAGFNRFLRKLRASLTKRTSSFEDKGSQS